MITLTRSEVGGSPLKGDMLAVIASGAIQSAHGAAIKGLKRRGLVTDDERLTAKGMAVRAKLKGLK